MTLFEKPSKEERNKGEISSGLIGTAHTDLLCKEALMVVKNKDQLIVNNAFVIS